MEDIDYKKYTLSMKERLKYGLIWLGLALMISGIVYSSLIPLIVFAPGASVENAFVRAKEDLNLTHQKNDLIVLEFESICKKLKMNKTVDECLNDLVKRSQDEEVRYFSEVLILAKRSGGNMQEIIRDSIQRISSKLEIEYEIQTMISAKKREFQIMAMIPVGMILYLRVCSPGFLDVLYGNVFGVCVMTGSFVIYLLILWWGRKLMDIPV